MIVFKAKIFAPIFLLVASVVAAAADVQCFVDGACANGQLIESIRNVDEVLFEFRGPSALSRPALTIRVPI